MGSSGSFTVTTTGSPTPTLTETGTLPSGVTFSSSNGTGTLSGTPAAGTAGSYPLTFAASNGVGTAASQSFTLAVSRAPTITSASSTTFTVGTAGTFTVTTTGSPTPTLTEAGTLPSGVTFSSSNGTGTLSGTPAAGTAGSYPLTFAASNGVGTAASQSFTLAVSRAPTITSASSTTFTVGTAGTFTVTTTGSPTPTLTEAGTLPSGVTFSSSNGTGTLSGTPAAGTAGSYPLTFAASNGVGTAASQSFTLTVNQAPAITSGSSTTFTVGSSGSFTVTTTGSPTPTLTETGTLPSGVTFSSSNGTGTLSGTPAAGTAGSYPLTFAASNGVGTAASQSFTLTVNGGVTGTAPSITSASSTTFTVGSSGSFTVTTTGSPTPTLTETGTLPSGVTFSSSNGTGTLSGTPAAGTGGSYPLTFAANNGVGTAASQSFTLTVSSGGSASWGQMDAWLQMNTSTPGTTLTTSIVAAGTVGGILTPNNFGETGDAGTPSGNANIVLATPFVTGSDANGYIPISVSGYNGGVSAAANFDLGIYADNSGSPGSLLCHTGTTSVTPGIWSFITLSLSGLGCPTLSANTRYWSAYITSSNSIGQSYMSGNCPGTSLPSVKASAAQGSTLLPSSFGANTAFSSECYSLYVTADDNTGSLTWVLNPSTPTGFTVATSQGSMGGSITVNGATYPNGTTTQSLALNNGVSTRIYVKRTIYS